MNEIVQTINSAGRAFAEFALPMLIQSSVLIVLVLLVDLLLRRRVRAVFRYWIWLLVLVKLVLPPSLGSPWSFGRWFGGTLEAPVVVFEEAARPQLEPVTVPTKEPMPRVVAPALGNAVLEEASVPVETPTTPIDVEPSVASVPQSQPQVQAEASEPAPSLSRQGMIFLAWATVVVALLLLLMQRALFVRTLAAGAEPAPDALAEALTTCRIGMNISRPVHVRVSSYATSPAVCGLSHPVILVPANLIPKLSGRDLRAVLLHELAHIKRGDLWINLVQTLLQIAYFYNPLLWLANAMIRRVREQAVDETVLVAMGESAGQYPETLVNVAKVALMRRPALSLRLIGVVESKSALRSRIRHMLARPFPKRARIGLLGLAVVAVVAGVLLPMADLFDRRPAVVNDGPLDIRFVGVCPDQSGDILNSDGRKIGTIPYPLGGNGAWREDIWLRDFVLEWPETDEPILLHNWGIVTTAGDDVRLHQSDASLLLPTMVNGRQRVFVDTSVPRVYRKVLLGVFPQKKTVTRVDVTLRYFYGPARETIVGFQGPFAYGQVLTDANMPGAKLTVLPERTYGTTEQPRACFRLELPYRTNYDTPILVYDTEGRRRLAWPESISSDNRSTTIEFCEHLDCLPLSRVARVAVEKAYSCVLKNVRVDYPDRSVQNHAPYLDVMAERLGLTGMTSKQLSEYRFKSPREVVEVIDILRSFQHVAVAFQVLRWGDSKFDITEFDQVTQDRIRRTASLWADSENTSAYGIQLGLMGGWPEFFDAALDRLSETHRDIPSVLYYHARAVRRADNEIASTIVSYTRDLTAEQMQRLKRVILTTDNRLVARDLLNWLRLTPSQATTDALWDLAQDDRPWIWWPALGCWRSRVPASQRLPGDLPETMVLRLALVQDELDDENLKAGTTALLRDIFTPELRKMAPNLWHTLADRISRDPDHIAATAVYVGFLRGLRSSLAAPIAAGDTNSLNEAAWDVAEILRMLNLWYGRDFGGFGTDRRRDSIVAAVHPLVHAGQFEPLLDEVLAWYDGAQMPMPLDLALTGQVVDTAGNPIPGAQLSFTKMEAYVTPKGGQSYRQVEAGQCRTDSEGHFALSEVASGDSCAVAVSADGYLPRGRLHVRHLTDGRYQFQEEGSPDNVIVMQRPGRISGRFLASDSAPLPGAEVTLFLNNRYSDQGRRRSLTTDDDGRFVFGNVSQGSVLLSHTVLRRAGEGRDYRREYAGPCVAKVLQIQEGGDIDDLVLDLSQSVCSLELTVVDRDNEPVPGITFYLDVPMSNGPYVNGTVFISDEAASDGVYRFDGFPPGTWRLRVNGPTSGRKTIDVTLLPHKMLQQRVVLEN